jgi:hypothetical protein
MRSVSLPRCSSSVREDCVPDAHLLDGAIVRQHLVGETASGARRRYRPRASTPTCAAPSRAPSTRPSSPFRAPTISDDKSDSLHGFYMQEHVTRLTRVTGPPEERHLPRRRAATHRPRPSAPLERKRSVRRPSSSARRSAAGSSGANLSATTHDGRRASRPARSAAR